jgi:rfaE bifunctional protein nucleotidyltransferase chain/domain
MGKVLSREELKKELEGEKQKEKKIVFTNGCFDIIHAGHIRYLKEAKSLGDILVIGLNSDRSVSTIKPGRPINPQSERAEVLSSLFMVDYVVIFDEDTPYELIKSLMPHVLVKGGDWKKEEIVGHTLVPDTRSLPYVEGISTTGIIRRIKDSS